MITHDTVSVLAGFSKRRGIEYPLLADPDAVIIPALGVQDDKFPKGTRYYGIAHPLTLVVDAEGVVRHRFSKGDYRDRPEISYVLGILRKSAS